ncbi:MAG: cadmium-translocating P-type ATPase [Acidobacteria bacterium]|nr:MAG: cadmium-translocating P-type ATPase [Acidobacteriota bacterium]
MANEPESQAGEVEHSGVERQELMRIGGTALVAAAVWFRVWEPFPRLSVLGLLGTLIGGWPIFHEAWENIRERRMTMELSMTIALLAALAIGEFFTALMITTFVLLAEVLEGLTVGRGRRAIRDLLDFLPATATVRRNGAGVRIPLRDVRTEDAVLVAPGERIPVDGTVHGGDSYVDQATITGESAPIRKTSGSLVYAGTINQSGVLEVIAERLGRDTSFGKIIEAVERAERSQAPVEKTADRYAGYLVYFALACAAVTFALTRDARSTISVIIVAGACGIAAGTPLAVLGAIGRAARSGAIIKGGRYLETLWRVDVVALDKTGTVTLGAPEVSEIRPRPGVSDRTVIETAAIAERRSEHPLARAIIRRADALGIAPSEPSAFSYLPGRGIVAQTSAGEILVGSCTFARDNAIAGCPSGDDDVSTAATEIVVARGGTCVGTILIGDTVRPEARLAIQQLRRLGLQTLLLTGDVRAVGDAVGHDLQIDGVHAELLPEQKVAVVRQLGAAGKTVAMVGDGVNDAPALVEAAVGVAMGSGTDVARESADIVLLGNDLSKFAETVEIAKRAHGIIRFNFVGTLAVDAIGVALAAIGLLNPLLAAFIHVASELTFILNSARLLPGRSPATAFTQSVAVDRVAPAA